MKTKLFLFCVLLSSVLFANSCKWLKSDKNVLSLTYKTALGAEPIKKELVGKASFMNAVESTTTANGQAARIVIYSIYLSNFDSEFKTLQRGQPKVDNDIKVVIEVAGAEGSTISTPLKVGTYNAAQFSDGINKYNKALDVRVNMMEGGAVQNLSISTVNKRWGYVKINSVDAEKVIGEVDMSDDFKTVKGEFSAKIVK